MQIRNLNRLLIPLMLVTGLFLTDQMALADKILPSIDNQYVSIEEQNPTRDAGYVVGDIIDRTIILTVKKPYELITESLPIVGYEHRYKGQTSGIELVKISTEDSSHADSSTHVLHLSYQVFTTGKLAKPAALRAEIVKLRNTETKAVYQYRIPSFSIRISPLSVFGAVKLKEEMSPLIPPLQLDDSRQVITIKVLAVILGLSLLGLLYILGSYAWLPKMGAPFAKAYREIRKLNNTPEDLKQGIARVHQSLNKTAGNSLFNNNLDEFIRNKANFASMQAEIIQFFDLSHHVFFDAKTTIDYAQSRTWLLQFCRHMRDCERGLKPNLPVAKDM